MNKETVCKNCGKEKSEHHIHPFNGTYHCEFGDDTKLFAILESSEVKNERNN